MSCTVMIRMLFFTLFSMKAIAQQGKSIGGLSLLFEHWSLHNVSPNLPTFRVLWGSRHIGYNAVSTPRLLATRTIYFLTCFTFRLPCTCRSLFWNVLPMFPIAIHSFLRPCAVVISSVKRSLTFPKRIITLPPGSQSNFFIWSI